jgi:hypothetical protein
MKNQRSRRWPAGGIGVGLSAFLVGCSGGADRSEGLPPQSLVEGRVEAATFPSRTTAFLAQDENGTVSTAPLSAAGDFSLRVPSAHTYMLSVALEGTSARLLFPKANRVDDAFVLSSDAAEIQLGSIRLLKPASLSLASSPAACADEDASDGGACSVVTDTVNCEEGYTSSRATCDDVSVVLAYGSVASVVAAAPSGSLFAVPAVEPPCDVAGCDLPDPGNPPQGSID